MTVPSMNSCYIIWGYADFPLSFEVITEKKSKKITNGILVEKSTRTQINITTKLSEIIT